MASVIGLKQNTPALAHLLLKERDLVEYVLHEAALRSQTLAASGACFKTPMAIAQKFREGKQSLTASFRDSGSGSREGLENMYAIKVADYRDQESHDLKNKSLVDLLWSVWCGTAGEMSCGQTG